MEPKTFQATHVFVCQQNILEAIDLKDGLILVTIGGHVRREVEYDQVFNLFAYIFIIGQRNGITRFDESGFEGWITVEEDQYVLRIEYDEGSHGFWIVFEGGQTFDLVLVLKMNTSTRISQ